MANGKTKRRNISSCARFALMMMTRYIFSLGPLIFLRETNELLCLFNFQPSSSPAAVGNGVRVEFGPAGEEGGGRRKHSVKDCLCFG